jgi:hypothetical protein
MAGSHTASRWALMSVAVVVFTAGGCGTTNPGAANAGNNPANTNGLTDDGLGPAEFVAVNEGGGDLAERMGGATYTGQATGPRASGTLTLDFSDDGVLLTLGGTVLGAFFGLGADTEVVFDYQTQAVTGTYRANDGSSRPLEDFLADAEQSIELHSVVVILVGDSLSVVTDYATNLSGQAQGQWTMILEGTLRFRTNEDLIGGLNLPGYLDSEVPEFTLLRQ